MEREVLEGLLADGASLEQIGRRLGKHPSTVGYWLRQHGLAAVNRKRHAARGGIDREQLVTMVEAGLSIAQMAARTGRGTASIRHWLRRHGLRTKAAQRRAFNAEVRVERPGCAQMLCATHGLTDFILRGDGAGYRCLLCRAAAVTARRRRVKAVLIEEAGGACVLCGYSRYPGALQFHHLEPAAKSFALSEKGVGRSIERARNEARKCVLLCSNCHAEVEGGFSSAPA